MAPHLDAVLASVRRRTIASPTPFASRERFYKRDVGPSRWLMVVVSFEQEPARIVTALGYGHGRAPAGWNAMNIRIDGLVFDRANYDADGDVLYLARGESNEAADAALTPEGHGVRYGDDGQVIGVTIINARRLLDRDGHLTITLPHEVRVDARDLAGALA